MAPQRSEEAEQARFVKWTHLTTVRALMPELSWLYHTPNGKKRDKLTAARLKAMGVVPGVPDLILPVRTSDYTGLAIEMKSSTGSLSPEQRDWQEHYIIQGWRFAVCRSAEDARSVLCAYLGVEFATAPPIE